MTSTNAAFLPNSFQTPNVFIDRLLAFLTKDEALCLWVATREILGWHDRVVDKRGTISLSTFQKAPVGRRSVIKAVKGLCRFGVLRAVGAPTNQGQEYEMVALTNPEGVDWQGLQERQSAKREAGRKRTEKARRARQKAEVVSQSYQRYARHTSQKDRPVVSLTNQQRYVRHTGGGVSDIPNKHILKPNTQTQKDSGAPAPGGASLSPAVIIHGIDLRQSVSAILEALEGQPPDVWRDVLHAEKHMQPTRHSPRKTLARAIGQALNPRPKMTPEETEQALALIQVMAEEAYGWTKPVSGSTKGRLMKAARQVIQDMGEDCPTVDELRQAYRVYTADGTKAPRTVAAIIGMVNAYRSRKGKVNGQPQTDSSPEGDAFREQLRQATERQRSAKLARRPALSDVR